MRWRATAQGVEDDPLLIVGKKKRKEKEKKAGESSFALGRARKPLAERCRNHFAMCA
jgi:hypothetical protein